MNYNFDDLDYAWRKLAIMSDSSMLQKRFFHLTDLPLILVLLYFFRNEHVRIYDRL